MVMPFSAALAEKLYACYPQETVQAIAAGCSAVRPVTFRVNTLKTERDRVAHALEAENIPVRNVPWYRDALIAESVREDALQRTTLYERGEIYLQSLSSMLPPVILQAKAGESVLDMTAAPGGKTTQISALSQGQALITACERDRLRAERLKYNIQKQGAPRVTVMTTDATRLDEFFRFDKILLDAPCSGSGTISPVNGGNFSDKLLRGCMCAQEALLDKAWKLLKRGGELVYSTCSVLPCENDGMLRRILQKKDAEPMPVGRFEGIPVLPSAEGTLCVMPNALYEGFFVAKVRKK